MSDDGGGDMESNLMTANRGDSSTCKYYDKRKGFVHLNFVTAIVLLFCVCSFSVGVFFSFRLVGLERRVRYLEETCRGPRPVTTEAATYGARVSATAAAGPPTRAAGVVSTQVFKGSELQARIDKLVQQVLLS